MQSEEITSLLMDLAIYLYIYIYVCHIYITSYCNRDPDPGNCGCYLRWLDPLGIWICLAKRVGEMKG